MITVSQEEKQRLNELILCLESRYFNSVAKCHVLKLPIKY